MAVYHTLTIAGVEKDVLVGTLSIQEVANGISTAVLGIDSEEGAYRPALGAEAILTRTDEDVSPSDTVVMAGYVDKVIEFGMGKQPIDHIHNRVELVDYNVIAERRYVTDTLSAGTLKSMLTTLVNDYLDDYGVALHTSQVDGPAVPEIVLDGVLLKDVLDRLSQHSGYTWKIDFDKKLRMQAAGDEASPFNVVDGDGNHVGDIEVERTRQKYYNRVLLRAGKPVVVDKTETFTGDGSDDTFQLKHRLIYQPWVGYGYVTHAGNAETLDLAGIGSGATWEYDPTDNTIQKVVGSAPANGAAISITFPAQFPLTVTAEDASDIALNGIYEVAVIAENVYDYDEAVALAESYLSEFLSVLETVKYRTREAGLHPGQLQTITAADRNLSGSYLITAVDTRNSNAEQDMEYSVTAIDAERFRGSFRNVYLDWNLRGGGGVAVSTPAASQAGSAPGLPFKSVQFNRSGVFGGDAPFTYDEDSNSLVCGLDSSITATNPQSCQAFGSDCHIADP